MTDQELTGVGASQMASVPQLVNSLSARFAGAVSEGEDGSLVVERDRLLDVARALKEDHGLDYLCNLSSVDWPDRFDVVYHIASSAGGTPITVHVAADKSEPVVPSLFSVYPGADFQEREVYDLMGIKFTGHPNLRRILLWDGFAGHPLRKDWQEPFYEADEKPFPSRWPEGEFFFAEDKLTEWGDNIRYPEGYAADDLVPDSLGEPIVLQADELRRAPLAGTERVVVNMGPQHPSTHGVFQMRLTLDGETIVDLEPVMGYLHRNHDKIGERNLWLANMPFTDRLDYFSQLSNEWGYAMAVERLMGVEVPERAEYIRVLMAELTRIQSHFTAIGFLLNDLGAFFTPVLYGFEERELILDLFEMATGARMMCNYMRFGGVADDLPEEFMPLAETLAFDRLERAIDEFDGYLTGNEIIIERLRGVGVLPSDLAVAYSASGPVLRASGVPYDIRRMDPYGIYDRFDWDVVSYPEGDAYARYLVRIGEIRQSIRIVQQALRQMPEGEIMGGKRAWQLRVPEGEAYSRIEGPRGELGYYCVSDGKANPYRYHVRSPCFVNLTALEEMCKGHKVADVVVILGSIDIVLGEVDR
jgi:NADH:ubiquinone oxidoreductase subunit D/NADH:ubiquinone oxidoreductase subunit C